MSPLELFRMMKQSPALHSALKADRTGRLYPFLRTHVQIPADQEEAWIVNVCRKCLKENEDAPEVDTLLSHPFDWPEDGWCIECVLKAFNENAPFWTPGDPDGWEQPEGAWWA